MKAAMTPNKIMIPLRLMPTTALVGRAENKRGISCPHNFRPTCH